MGLYRLVTRSESGREGRVVMEFVDELAQALKVAQRYSQPVQVWLAADHICTIDSMAGDGSMWVITQGIKHAVAHGGLVASPSTSGQLEIGTRGNSLQFR